MLIIPVVIAGRDINKAIQSPCSDALPTGLQRTVLWNGLLVGSSVTHFLETNRMSSIFPHNPVK